MASSLFSRSMNRGVSLFPGRLILAGLIVLGSGKVRAAESSHATVAEVAPGGLAEAQKDRDQVPQDEQYFAPILRDIRYAIADVADLSAMSTEVLEGGSPHLVLFVEGMLPLDDRAHPVLQTMRALAENHRLGLEHQCVVLDDGAPLFGFLLYQPFPTLEMAWEIHPFESSASVLGAWLQPFADLSDVESVRVVDDRATLEFSEAAARRIDALSELQGHRNYRVRAVGMAGETQLGSYTWVPGLRSVPGVPASFTCVPPRGNGQPKEGVTVDYLRQRFTVHAAAREQIRRELDLADDVCWTVAAAPPRYTEPFFAWMVHAPEVGGKAAQVPWFRADSKSARRWLHVQSADAPVSYAAIPAHWTFTRDGGRATLTPRPATDAESLTRDEEFAKFLRQNIDGEVAIVMQGQVAGVVAVKAARPEMLALNSMPATAAQAMERLWNTANTLPGVVPVSNQANAVPAKKAPPPDSFQVRLMAEPQDRVYVPVTHFDAPGLPKGTVVAVLNDIILDGRSVTGAHLENRDEKVYLRLTFTPEAQEALGGACFGNMGKQLAILYNDRLLCAPTIDDWEIEELSFKGMDSDWPDVAQALMEHLAAKG